MKYLYNMRYIIASFFILLFISVFINSERHLLVHAKTDNTSVNSLSTDESDTAAVNEDAIQDSSGDNTDKAKDIKKRSLKIQKKFIPAKSKLRESLRKRIKRGDNEQDNQLNSTTDVDSNDTNSSFNAIEKKSNERKLKKLKNNKDEIFEKRKKQFLALLERTDKFLSGLEDKINSADELEGDIKSYLIEKIDNNKNVVKQWMNDVESAQTLDELRSTAKTIRISWHKNRGIARMYAQAYYMRRFMRMENRITELYEKLSQKLGSDKESLSLMKTHIDAANEAYNSAKQALFSLSEDTLGQGLVPESRKYLRSAYEHLREALKYAKQARIDYRNSINKQVGEENVSSTGAQL